MHIYIYAGTRPVNNVQMNRTA